MHATALAFVFALASLFDDLPATAVARTPVVDGQPAVTLRLLAQDRVLGPGSEARLGVHVALSPGWHIYGANPGSAGFPTHVAWQTTGMAIAAEPFPPAQMFKESDDVFTYGYANDVLLAAVAHVPEAASGPREMTVTAHVRFLACKIICAPGEATLTRTLVIGPEREGEADSSDTARAFAHTLTAPTGADLTATPEAARGWRDLAQALGLAFLGGLILNAMPCVLPVLALKAMGLAQARHHSSQAWRHALSYGAGVVGAMVALAAVVLAVRAAGHSVGWGFQFQEPLFIAGVAVCMLLFACNCFGLFEVMPDVNRVAQAHARATGMRRSVLEGVLAVAVATPCSAPFLGTAVAFALGQAAPVVVAVFVTIGMGLAFPWAVLVLAPGLAQRLPRPGPWMGQLKMAMGFCLLATVVWLTWLFGRARQIDDMALLLALLWATAALAWVVGQLAVAQPQRLVPMLALALVALAALGQRLLGAQVPLPASAAAARASAPAPYSDALVQAELALGHPVLVDFTADWCITCKYNEHHVLSDARVQAALAAHHVTVLRADWTRRDNAILAVLMAHGRAGVPMYLIFDPRAPSAPKLLPEVLTVATVVEAVAPL